LNKIGALLVFPPKRHTQFNFLIF